MFFFNFSGEVFRFLLSPFTTYNIITTILIKIVLKQSIVLLQKTLKNFLSDVRIEKLQIFSFISSTISSNKKVLFRWIYNFNSIGWFLKVYVKWYIKASLKMPVKFSIFFILASSAFQPSYRRYKPIGSLFHLYLHGWDLRFKELWVWWLSCKTKLNQSLTLKCFSKEA